MKVNTLLPLFISAGVVITAIVLGNRKVVVTNTVSGIVTTDSGTPLGGASLTLQGKTVVSDSSGYYYFSNVIKGDYALIYSSEGYEGGSRMITIHEGANTGVDVMMVQASNATATLSGRVSDANGYLQGVSVTLLGVTAITDSSGYYYFSNITPGTYPITFSKPGYVTQTL